MMEPRNRTVSCAVAICDSPNDAIYHHFPKDPLRRKKWESACYRKDPLGKYPRICENHFEEKDYKRDLKGELLGLILKRKLKEDAIPSRGLIPGEGFEQHPRKKKRIEIVDHFEDVSNQICLETFDKSSQTIVKATQTPVVEKVNASNQANGAPVIRVTRATMTKKDRLIKELDSLREKNAHLQEKVNLRN
ncbi:uncharacterized protein [Lepeophtheirus salmonis]|uniref:uncharacterized protein isoform X2 n=1 Tax=Lepeophtheirus salmonis TaxID=72036 RepID=UPI003AF3642D